MDGLFDGMMEGSGANLAVAIVAVSIGLALLVGVLLLIKAWRGGGGATGTVRGRQPRLAVLDTISVDTRRRLVLIRRDDVEHLVMIGGPSDIVVESRIALTDIPAVENGFTKPKSPAPAPEAAATRPTTPAPAPIIPSPQVQRPVAAPLATSAAVAAVAANPKPVATPAGQFPVERFSDTAAATPPPPAPYSEFHEAEKPVAASIRQAKSPEGIAGGNPFDEADFDAVLDAQLAQDLPPNLGPAAPTQVAPRPAASVAPAAPAPVPAAPSIDPPAARREEEGTLQEEMAKLLADMAANRR